MQKKLSDIKEKYLREIILDSLAIINNSKTAYKRECDNPICKFIPIILEYNCLFKEYYLKSISFDNDGLPFQVAYFFKTKEKAMDYITSFSSIKQLKDTTEIVQACTYYWKSYDREL